jgi:glutaminase
MREKSGECQYKQVRGCKCRQFKAQTMAEAGPPLRLSSIPPRASLLFHPFANPARSMLGCRHPRNNPATTAIVKKPPARKSIVASPPPSPIQRILESLHSELKQNRCGEVATYIPELGKADPEWFGICLVTADGRSYQVGDCDQPFTIQSISKPFIYGAALEDKGKEKVLEKVWMEPSGEAFNAISLRPGSGKPENPMINAGAITSTSLVEGTSTRQKFRRILQTLSAHAGRRLSLDQDVYQSESSTGHRNRGIGYMLRNFDILEDDPKPSLEAYFMQCAVSVTCRDLGIMAATLANGGVNPLTNVTAVARDHVENILSVMGSCGMYDAAGEWIYNVGMPAKSGVAGGILAVLPGQFGIGVFSPRLDECGNSVRGIEVCREISRRFALHMFNVPRLSASVIRRVGGLSHTRSSRLRSAREMEALRQSGDSIRVVELQGDLNFGSAELAVRQFTDAAPHVREILVDFSHVTAMDPSAAAIFAMAFATWVEAGRRVSICRCERLPQFQEAIRKEMPRTRETAVFYQDMARALEAAENALLAEMKLRRFSSQAVKLSECELLSGVDARGLATLRSILKPVRFADGDIILRAGDPPGGMFFILRGKASAWILTGSGHERRVATFSPGMNFGEMALLDRSPRSAEVRADGPIEAMEFGLDAFHGLEQKDPGLQIVLLRNLSRILAKRLREANLEVGILLS